MSTTQYVVDVVRLSDGEVVKVVQCRSERDAEKVSAGMDINLNHEEYYTRVREREK